MNQQMNWLPLGHAIFTVLKNGLAHCSVGGWAAVCNYSHTCGPQVRQGWGVWLQAAHRRIPLTSQTTPNGNVLKEMGRVKCFLKNRKVSHAHKIPLPWKFFTHTGPWGGGRFPWTGFWPLSRRLVFSQWLLTSLWVTPEDCVLVKEKTFSILRLHEETLLV